jgi:hypothetical protein
VTIILIMTGLDLFSCALYFALVLKQNEWRDTFHVLHQTLFPPNDEPFLWLLLLLCSIHRSILSSYQFCTFSIQFLVIIPWKGGQPLVEKSLFNNHLKSQPEASSLFIHRLSYGNNTGFCAPFNWQMNAPLFRD